MNILQGKLINDLVRYQVKPQLIMFRVLTLVLASLYRVCHCFNLFYPVLRIPWTKLREMYVSRFDEVSTKKGNIQHITHTS